MADNTGNLNIFGGGPAQLREALPLFRRLTALALPAAPADAEGATLYSITPLEEAGTQYLPAFTAPELLNPPFISQPPLPAALLLFHAPAHDHFIFNPAHPQSRQACSPLKASRREISLLAGFLKSGDKAAGGDAVGQAEGEYALGNLHSAHYLYDLAAARNPGSRARFAMGFVLAELGLLQEAYDLLKSDTDPEARLCLAMIHRRTGDAQQARSLLSSLGKGTPLDEKAAVEEAWLDLETVPEDAEKTFQRLSSVSFEKTEALAGLGAAMAKNAFRTKDKGRLAAAAAALRSALVSPSPASARIFFQLGSLYFRSGDMGQAEVCYARAAALSPSPQALANLALTMVRTGKFREAAQATLQVALTDMPSARRLAGEFPKPMLGQLFPPPPEPVKPEPEPEIPAPSALGSMKEVKQEQPSALGSMTEITPGTQAPPGAAAAPDIPAAFRKGPGPATATPAPEQAAPPAADQGTGGAQPAGGLDGAGASYKFINPSAPAAGLDPARPRDASVSGRTFGKVDKARNPEPAREVKIESLRDVMQSPSAPTEEESRRDDFISRAFKLASALEDELNKKIHFNLDGLSEVERKLRLVFLKGGGNPQANIEAVKDCAAFLCYFLQERQKGRLIKFPDFDPWGWPMVLERPGVKFTTYPIQRTWRLLWQDTVPEPGWLTKYFEWVSGRLAAPEPPPSGLKAAKQRLMSHQERLADAQTEHRRMMVLASSLPETSHIELGRSGILKISNALREKFKPDVPPTADGWKLLRCYGHVLAEIAARDFKAAWYNTDGEDGGWAMEAPWKTLFFPLGKVYKTAAAGGDLDAWYDSLLAEKLRVQGGPTH
ncbi:MAG: tetratricopeptide repeat protein [Elusimicrobiales bacterium]